MVCIFEHGRQIRQGQSPAQTEKIELMRLGAESVPARNRATDKGLLTLVSCLFMRPVKRPDLLFDALALCGFPVKWTHLGGNVELPNERNGLLLPPNVTSIDLTATLKRYHGLSPVAMQRMRDAAWKTCQNEAKAERQHACFAAYTH